MASTQRLFYTTSCHCWGWSKGTLFWGEGVPSSLETVGEEAIWYCLLLGGCESFLFFYPLSLVLLLLLFLFSYLLAPSSKLFLSPPMIFAFSAFNSLHPLAGGKGSEKSRGARKQDVVWRVLVGAQNWGAPFLNHQMPSLNISLKMVRKGLPIQLW